MVDLDSLDQKLFHKYGGKVVLSADIRFVENPESEHSLLAPEHYCSVLIQGKKDGRILFSVYSVNIETAFEMLEDELK